MHVVIAYDVNTDKPEGKQRLRRVAKLCEGVGQRVQRSVFECRLNETQLTRFLCRLEEVIDKEDDSLRVYRIAEPRDKAVHVLGKDAYINLDGPLVF